MLARFLALAAMLVPAAAFADVEIKGWAKKGDAFVVERTEYKLDSGTGDKTATTFGEVYSVGKIEPQSFHLEVQPPTGDPLPDVKGKAAYDTWLKAHPLEVPASVPAKAMRNGKVALSVLEEKSRASPWDSEKNGFKVEGGTTCTDPSSPMTCHPDDASYTAVAINGASKRPLASMLTAAKGIWQAYPSPDSAHVAWVFSGKEDLGSDQSQDIDEVWISGDGSFAVEILGLMDAKDTALPRVVKALTEAGFPPAKTGKAVKPRKASVVYTAKGAEAKAKAVAAAIPGGATVEPLTWKSDCDVVVAVGDSAK